MKIRVADYIAGYLESLRVRKVFLLSGGGMMHLLDAVGRREKLGYVCNHHEQASGMAAEAYARRSGGLGVCYATSGPGGTNTLTAISGAWLDSSPVLFIAGQSKLSQTIQHTKIEGLRQFGTFEVDIIPAVKGMTKYAAFIDDAKRIRFHLEKACTLALSGRPGPVFLDIPVDIQGAFIEPDLLEGYSEASVTELAPTPTVIDKIISRIAAAKRPVLLAGHGVRVSGAETAFREMIQKLNIPVVTTPLAVDLLEYEHPLFVGHPGMKGDRAGNFAVQTADLIISLGSSLHVVTTGYELDQFAPGAYKIQVDLDPAVLKREQVGVQEKVVASVQGFVGAMNQRLGESECVFPDGPWHARGKSWKSELAVMNEPHRHVGEQINYYDVNDVLSDLAVSSDTIVTDAGSAFYVIGQAFRTKHGQRIIISGGLGTMGFALPAATGAAMAAPSSRVICVTGDGSLQTNIHELGTIRHYGLNAKIIVVNNEGYVSIRNTQNNFFKGHLVGTDKGSGLFIPKHDKIAEAYEIPYFSAKIRGELRSTLERALAQPGPVFCEIFAQRDQEILPTVSSVKLESGAMKSKPLQEMYPFMDEATQRRYMKVPT